MADNVLPSEADTMDELASIVTRTIDLMELVTNDLDDTLDAAEVVKRLRRIGKHSEAEELDVLFARAEELKSASSDSS